jgi:hypothetical protein
MKQQDSNEPLDTYSQSVREAALVLRITETESRVVERIIDGLTPNQSWIRVSGPTEQLSAIKASGCCRPQYCFPG